MSAPTTAAPAPVGEAPVGVEVLDLHGLLQVRVVDGTPGDVEGVRRQLGLPTLATPRTDVPTLTIRFARDVLGGARLHPLGAREAGFTDDAFVLLRAAGKAPTQVRVPVDRLGENGVELVVRSGTRGIPLLLSTLHLMLLDHGVVALHAAAVRVRQQGMLITGWSKGGKTELLLGLTGRGADYVGDEWVYLRPEDGRMFGLPEPLRLWDWHLAQRPDLRRRLSPRDRGRLRATAVVAAGPSHAVPGAELPSTLRRALLVARRQLSVRVPPERLFGAAHVRASTTLDRVVLVMARDDATVELSPVAPEEVVQRMLASLEHEREDLLAADRMFRYAFPGRCNRHLARAGEQEVRLLTAALRGRPAHRLDHPSPVDLARLADAVLAVP